jgi:hypothetical protein
VSTGVTLSSGPFEITADQIQRLGPRFTSFANKLLTAEHSSQGLAGHTLSLNANETARDGGVDAALRGSHGTGWIPVGDTAFQFKRSSQSTPECVSELVGATRVHEMLKGGGSFVIMLGGDAVPDQGVQNRQKAIADKAVELGLIEAKDEQRLRVYDANLIARWASEFPALAVDPILQGIQVGAIDFERWRASRVHQHRYCPDPQRLQQIDDLRNRLASNQPVDIRLQGDSGIGKTRLALEALNDVRFRSLVAYVDDASQAGGGLIESLIDQGRHAIVVVDECPADRHLKLTAKLPVNPGVKLITIGDVGSSRSSGPVVGLSSLAGEAMDALLSASFPALSSEARRFVQEHSNGAPAWAIWLAEAVERTPDAQAADMIARHDIEHFITKSLPEGADFFFAAVLALFERVGWDRETRTQMELLASFAGASPADLERTLHGLETRSLIRRQGRYRAVGPAPVAIYLAAEGWREHGQRLVDELFPLLNDELAIAMFRRLAQLGRFEPARAVLPKLLTADGPFGALQSIEDRQLGALLTQLAIVLPDEVASHLCFLIEEASLDHLIGLERSRRDLVWTLEKLAWHTRTFERAADALLKLAVAENESYANNATGTWLDLFGATLPSTAAGPHQRADYITHVSRDPRPAARALAVRATGKAFGPHESILVSGEIQGGVLVEPRGTPSTWLEVGEYRRRLLGVLNHLRDDEAPSVAENATKTLLNTLPVLIDDQFVGLELAEILATLTGDPLSELRVEIEHLASVELRYGKNDGRLLESLDSLKNRLPKPQSDDKLQVLLRMRHWDLGEGELLSRIKAVVYELARSERVRLVGLLDQEIPAAWELGTALAHSDGESGELLTGLTKQFATNPGALAGYLASLADSGDLEVFDRFLDGPHAETLDERARLNLAVRGPVTRTSTRRILAGVTTLPVREAAATLFGWGCNLSTPDVVKVVDDWLDRIGSQDDYNAAVDWLNLTVPEGPIAAELLEPTWRLMQRRETYPDVGPEGWDWAQLASRVVAEHGPALLELLLDLVERGDLSVHAADDAALIGACVMRDPVHGWANLGARLENPASWRLSMQLRGKIQSFTPIEVLDEWIGTNVERARIAAAIANPGEAEPTALAILLLDRFGDDDRIWSSLRSTFESGSWFGSWSSRITTQIEQLTAWQGKPNLPLGVRQWAKVIIESLRSELAAVLEREEERGY